MLTVTEDSMHRYSLIRSSRFPIPHFRFPIPDSLKSTTCVPDRFEKWYSYQKKNHNS
ncbi:hypothetical protein [Moorena sp. SIO3I6]|uniref:hypothetical protein n=1 Tax=Moorena sp. SIO3I6 TaxID=2607831 RepID=UPI0013F6EC52|nr:hypothetical protein [Moorena sp. SIO3I6]NEP22638.1 hypothetical protein [Moorena sp. SIO3I6]